MLYVRGKGLAKSYSKDPFYEDPQPKAFYHPTQEIPLSQAEKQLALSPKRSDSKRQQQQQTQGKSAEKKFLAGSHAIKPLSSVQSHAPKSPDSSNFDESWPDSERPSSPSLNAGDKWRQESLPYASVRKHADPTFTSRPMGQGQRSGGPAGEGGIPISQYAGVSGSVTESSLEGALPFPCERAAEKKGKVAAGSHGKAGKGSGPGDTGSVLQRYIERFRHGTPMSREERLKMEGSQKEEFWWLGSNPPTPNSTSTPKEEQGRSLARTCQGQGTLTVENVRKRDDLDSSTARLQEKAERLLHSAGSVASSGPVVSTEGLGSTGSDISGSTFSEPLVRPALVPRDGGVYPRPDKAGGAGGRAGKPSTQQDILYKWRLQRKLESARQTPFAATHSTEATAPPKTAAETEVERCLASFRETLLERGSVVKTQLHQARVEKQMKQVQSVMDTGVQTSPIKPLPFSSHPHLPLHPPSGASMVKDRRDVSTECCDIPDIPEKPDTDSRLQPSAAHQGVTRVSCPGWEEQQREPAELCKTISAGVQYRQYLEAERPHDGGDAGDTTLKAAPTRESPGSDGANESPASAGNGGAMESPVSAGNGAMESPVSAGNGAMESPVSAGNGVMESPVSAGSDGYPQQEMTQAASTDPIGPRGDGGSASKGCDRLSAGATDSRDAHRRGSTKARSGSESDRSSSRSVSGRGVRTQQASQPASHPSEEHESRSSPRPKKNRNGRSTREADQSTREIQNGRRATEAEMSTRENRNSRSPREADQSTRENRNGRSTREVEQSTRGNRNSRSPREADQSTRENRNGRSPRETDQSTREIRNFTSATEAEDSTKEREAEHSSRQQQAVQPSRENVNTGGGERVSQRRPPTDSERMPGALQRSGGERSHRSGVMPPPQHSSSPARTSLSSAIGQVVHDRMFDLSGSVMSSVDSWSSLQHSALSPLPPGQHTPVTGFQCESDGEFEDDPLLEVLRQQRQQHITQLRILDSILAERDTS